jgi:undecaprenyl-diphosphatase
LHLDLDFFQTTVYAIIQGITELFPISSVSHGVFTPYVFQWNLRPQFLKEQFLPFVVMLHVGTAVALLIYFWREWVDIIRSLFSGDRKVLIIVIAATIPAAVIGFALQKPLTNLFSNIRTASIFLILNGFFLIIGEKMRLKGTKDIEDLNVKQAVVIGFFQALALLPGFSRSGSSMVAGMWAGLKQEAAARFSMILATPIIAGAAMVEVPKASQIGGAARPVKHIIAWWHDVGNFRFYFSLDPNELV